MSYNESSIKVLSDREHVRNRPLMYISSERPSYQLFTEILDNAVDEAMNGYATQIGVEVCFDHEHPYFTIEDNGRGIPQGINKTTGKPTPEIIYTKLNSGGKYDTDSYGKSSGLHGVGASVCNFLSSEFKVDTWRDKTKVHMDFKEGEMLNYMSIELSSNEIGTSGTLVECHPDMSHKLIKNDPLDNYIEDIQNRIILLKTLMPHVNFIYQGMVVHEADFSDFVPFIKNPLLEENLTFTIDDLMFSVNWSKDNNRYIYKTYCNSLYNPQGGDHERGVADAINEYFGTTDATLGVNFAISCMYPSVEYDSQAKLKAVSSDMRAFVKDKVLDYIKKYMRENPKIKESIVELIKYKRNEINKRNNKGNVKRDRKNTFLNTLGVSGFADCTCKDRSNAEIFFVEGNSAAGSAKQARNIETQAILPLRGKFINAYTADVKTLLNNTEVATIVSSIDAGVFQDVNIKKSRYSKLIIFTDADEDGKDIATQLIAFFMNTMPEMIEAGYLYLALPPLYGTYEGKKFIPIHDEETKEDYLKKGYHIQRYKGLGEMNPEQLRISCMDPETRHIIRIDKSPECAEHVSKVMGSDSSYRRQLLIEMGILA